MPLELFCLLNVPAEPPKIAVSAPLSAKSSSEPPELAVSEAKSQQISEYSRRASQNHRLSAALGEKQL